LCYRGRKNRRAEKAEGGLEREKSHPARLASLALFYFFGARREPVHLQTMKTLPDYIQEPHGYKLIQTESPGLPYGLPPLFSGGNYWNN